MFNIFRRKSKVPAEEREKQEAYFPEKRQPEPYAKKMIEELEVKNENKEVIKVLKSVQDPELDIDIWSLGLVYDLFVSEGQAKIVMTFTSPTCPYGPRIIWELEDKLRDININPKIELVFNPPWEPSEDLKDMLGR